jgi:hypothetical protein
MKSIKYITLLLLAAVFITSCERDLDSANVSKTTVYAQFTLNGEDLIILPNGTAYTDAGAVAKEGTKALDVKVENPVDVNTMGVYTINYSAKNSDGFEAFATRTVIVLPPAPLPTDDLSGSYQRNAGAQGTSTWTKVTDGLYKVTDVGGAGNPDDYVYVFNPATNKVIVPKQPIGGSGSEVYTTNATGGTDIDFVPGGVGTESYKWVVHNSGYGSAVRTFVKVN